MNKDDQRFLISDLFGKLEAWLTPLFVAMAAVGTFSGTLIVVLIGTSVTMRYFAYAPFRFTEELVGLLMTAAFFLALPLVTLRGRHVRVLALVSILPVWIKGLVSIISALFGLAFCIWFLSLCLPWLEFAIERNIKTEVGRLLMYPWMALLPISMLFTAIAFVIRCATDSKSQTGNG